jgi:single-stranded-DNA-specific exonuclease
LEDNMLFYISPVINHWIIWIIAGRLSENFNKPCICLKDEWDKLVASCRSPKYFSIIEILEKYESYFLAFWGHKQAAGFSISKDNFSKFKSEIIKEVNKFNFNDYRKEVCVNKIITLEEIWFNLIKKVNEFKPFGIWNEKPIFMIEDLDYDNIELTKNWSTHLRFITRHWFKILAFGMWEFYEKILKTKKKVDIVFDLSEDNWNGNRGILLKVVDVVLR